MEPQLCCFLRWRRSKNILRTDSLKGAYIWFLISLSIWIEYLVLGTNNSVYLSCHLFFQGRFTWLPSRGPICSPADSLSP